jgi:hypothetical protein
MWQFYKEFLHRSWQQALANGSSTGISLLWLGFGVLILGFIFTVGIEWLTGTRNLTALLLALKSWKSFVSAFSALCVGWLCLFIYSTLGVGYGDHQKLLAAQAKLVLHACSTDQLRRLNQLPIRAQNLSSKSNKETAVPRIPEWLQHPLPQTGIVTSLSWVEAETPVSGM